MGSSAFQTGRAPLYGPGRRSFQQIQGVNHMAEEKRASGSGRQRSSAKDRRTRRSGKARIAGAFLYVLFVIGLSAILATVGWVWACDLLGLNKEYASTIITIDEDADFGAIVDTLEDEGLIEYKFLFKLYAWFSHAEDKISAGTYELNTEMDYRALVANMGSSSSTRQETDVTIPEGYTIDQIFTLLDERGVSSVDKLRDMAANWNYAFDWLQDIPLGDYHRLEGYLFPDTYTFYLGEDPKYIINKMLVNFDSKMDEYMEQFEGEDAQYSLHDIVTIASMIEKETDSEDYQTIASVLYNRLENPSAETVGYLQVDAILLEQADFFFQAPTEYAEKDVKKRWKEDTPRIMEELIGVLESIDDMTSANAEKIVLDWIAQNGYHLGNVMNAFRLAVVGSCRGPHMFEITELMPKSEVTARIRRAIATLP